MGRPGSEAPHARASLRGRGMQVPNTCDGTMAGPSRAGRLDRNAATVSRTNGQSDTEYLYRAIAGRNFERHCQLADHVKVMGANLANGLLTIDSRRPRPDAAAA